MATTEARPAVETPPGSGLRAVHTRTATLGFLLAAAGFVILLISFVIFEPELVAELGPFLLVFLVGAGLVWRFGTWAKVVGAILGLAFLAMFGPFMVGSLAWPYSFLDFVPSFLVLLGLILAVGGSIAAIVRRNDRAAAATGLERQIRIGVLAVSGLAVVVSGAWSLVPAGGELTVPAGSVFVDVEGSEFAGAPYEIDANQPVTFAVTNNDPFIHTFTVPALGIDQTLRPASTAMVDVTAAAGSYTLYCVPHSDTNDPDPETAGMAAEIVAR